MVSKIKKSQIIRHIIQLIAFILLPGLYSMTFSEVKTVYQMIINGNVNFLEALPSLIEFIAIMLLTIVLGRWFCGWICAFGAYNDLIYFISKKIFTIKFRVDEKVDSILKYFKYLVLLFIIAISWTMGSSILESTSPWDVFGQITDVSTIFSNLLVGLIFLILITIGSAFIERFFCRYLCPLGAIFSIISKIGIVKINKPKADCGKCRACTMNCSMGLPLYKVNCVKGGDCINCLKCTEVCYRNNANVNVLGRDLDAKLTGSVAMATFLGIYGFTNFAGNAVTKSGIAAKSNAVSSNLNSQTESAPESSKLNHETTSSNTVQNNASEYKDGTYTGSGTGYRGGTTKISVTVSDGKISSIQAISNQDTPKFYQRAEGTIIKSIISKQSTSVDTVSGATYSSKGIMSAVTNALNEAK
ncbi:ferredoxin [Clostridium beijerinckii]|uniref:4Fe-4S binding protein n=1 Tax=Clostridium beijerinckii TaxID=1520 RepID=A0AB74VE78_CLOBE|nr:4Fe-4S binding protein [Clostridium beijerinckii]NRZ29009.1 polyferredoxin/major membrane immunogen (membrane-anchored lipoprotein) [Clostridium beijerinckii]NYB95219.1 polyferredoxin/major membrane immunogen (membrane-anchored lipoprotein) [Clostridium beijerinckii]OOM27343.1 putative electron transport protein YccM [Clostridium beijerinckii]QUN34667.1 4Fe-4S binding protein [Clostridium beijerinckii]SQB00363.1 FMN-binding domain-containing protein [Clostridium beijerinckii]